MAVAQAVRSALAQNPEIGNVDVADQLLGGFVEDAGRISHAVDIARHLIRLEKGTSGRIPLHWHNPFYEAVVVITELNGIDPKITSDRSLGTRGGKFFEVAHALQQMLPPRMRAATDEALFKRLNKSRRECELR
jgi:hypothetical protein